MGLLLACGGLDFDATHLEDASYAQAASAGYTLPEGADHIYTYDHQAPDRRSSYLRYTLPSEPFDRLIEQYRSSEVHTETSSWTIPPQWPDFRDDPPASWWQPTGTVVFQRGLSSAPEGDEITMDKGALAVFDETTHTVFIWMWQWEMWTLRFQPDQPLVIHLSEGIVAQYTELECTVGKPRRRPVKGGVVRFTDAPVDADCEIQLRGGAPLRAALPPGSRDVRCDVDGDQMNCTPLASPSGTATLP